MDPALKAQLEQVLVGGLENRPIVIAAYDPGWPARFEQERERVRRALGRSALRIEHIGSTAVPGLAAKPVVDLVVGVADTEDVYVARALESVGYELRVREPGHRMFRTPGRDVHVHVWPDSDPEIERHLCFRDRLREDSDDRAAYERLKRELAARQWEDTNEYAQAKGELIDAIVARAGGPPRLPGS
jgi:GrpB-like predicted nucleotidyltransferase (UPF0157 family)